MKLKTVVVSLYEAFPPASGAATVTYNIARNISGERYLIQLGNRGNNSERIDSNLNLINIHLPSTSRILKGINLPFLFAKITHEIKKLEPDVIMLEGASWALYYLILLYLIKILRIDSKIIYHAHNVEFLLRKQKNNSLIACITKLAEGMLMRGSDISFAVSEIDAIHFEKIYGIKPSILPNGVDIETFTGVNQSQVVNIKRKYNLNGRIVLFMGLPSFRPNKEAIDFLINKVFPMVVKEFPEAELVVIGGKLGFKKDWLINPGTIPFEEIPAFVKASEVCVAPIFSGSGTRLKILEYMAAGKPVVSTTKGAEGIAVATGKNIMIAENADEFKEKILYLFNHHEIGDRIGRAGEMVIRSNYSWPNIMQDVNGTILRLLSEE
jgi:glycosyltransferase involved in cell wall biosynthesis